MGDLFMNLAQATEKIDLLLSKGNLRDAVEALSSIVERGHPLYQDLILLKAKWHSAEAEYHKGVLHRSDYELVFNQTVQNVQFILSQIGADLLSASQKKPLSQYWWSGLTIAFIAFILVIVWRSARTAQPTNASVDRKELQSKKDSFKTEQGAPPPVNYKTSDHDRKVVKALACIGVWCKKGSGADDWETAKKILAEINLAAKEVKLLVGNTSQQACEHCLGMQWDLTKDSKDKQVFGISVQSYKIAMTFSWFNNQNGLIQPPLVLEARLDTNKDESKEKIESQAFQLIINKLKDNKDFFDLKL